MRWFVLCACLVAGLGAGCGPSDEPPAAEQPAGRRVSEATLEAVEQRMQRDREAAADELVTLVLSSPLDVPAEELQRLGRLLLESPEREAIMERLRAARLAHPDSRSLEQWLEDLEDWNASVMRGVDVPDDDYR